jgi:hypothetical protein
MIDQITKKYLVTIEIRANTQSDIDTIWMNIENNLNEDRATYEVKITDRKEIYAIGEKKEWVYSRPIVGTDENGQPIIIDSWGDS